MEGAPKTNCSCSNKVPVANKPVEKKTIKSPIYIWNAVKAFFSFLLGLLIAFFPKCPVCWAVYMSMFSGIGLAQLPYMKWLFPVLLVLFGLNLFLLYRKGRKTGFGPFLLTLAGAIIILAGRNFFINEKGLLYAGMALVLIGSLWNSFSGIRFKTITTISH